MRYKNEDFATNSLTKPFWDSCNNEKLAFPYCSNCDIWKWYPTYKCPACRNELQWKEVSLKAKLYSWTILHRAYFEEFEEQIPLIIAVAEIDDAPGVRLIANMYEDEKNLKLNLPLNIEFIESDRIIKPIFSISKLGIKGG